jgi:polyphenol oxidase
VLELLPAGLPAPAAGWFTTRAGGVSVEPYASLDLALHVEDEPAHVLANRRLVARAAGLEDGALVFAEQVHGAHVAVVDPSSAGDAVAGVDALVTTTPGLGLVVLAADCLPVLLADPGAGVVAAAHAGRQGLLAGVLEATLAAMQDLGASAATTSAVLGPAACGGCYEVPAAMADDAEHRLPGSRSTTRQGTPSVDLAAGARAVLRRAGVAEVTAVGGCTLEQPDRWYSYRRDRTTGRHGGLVRLAP